MASLSGGSDFFSAPKDSTSSPEAAGSASSESRGSTFSSESGGSASSSEPEEFHVTSRGTDLFCLRQGAGPVLVMVHGGGTNSDFYRETASILARRFTVIRYDRCGSGRSGEPADGDWSIAAQAEDLAAVIRAAALKPFEASHLSEASHPSGAPYPSAAPHPSGTSHPAEIPHLSETPHPSEEPVQPNSVSPVFLAAHSAGGAIALQLIQNHPELVRAALLHEPVAGTLIPADDPAARDIAEARRLIEAGKPGQAIRHFTSLIGPEEPQANGRAVSREEASRLLRDTMNFLRHEFVPAFTWEADTERLAGFPLAIGIGEDSWGTHRWKTARILAERLACELCYFPGGHRCAYLLPAEFADLTAETLMDISQ